jgi:hypothetical protein
MNLIPIVFALNFSLLLLHEMDAIRAKEWRMFIILKDMREESAYIVFSLVHLPLYFWMIHTISQTVAGGYVIPYLALDIFLIFHTVIHFCFRKKAANGFTSAYSNALIYGMGVLTVLHLVLLFV